MGDFIHTKLDADRRLIDHDCIEAIRRIKSTGQCFKQEVLVVFKDEQARDLVASCARNLTPYTNQTGQPMAGLRIDVPEHLRGTFKLLENYGFRMKKRHGQGLK